MATCAFVNILKQNAKNYTNFMENSTNLPQSLTTEYSVEELKGIGKFLKQPAEKEPAEKEQKTELPLSYVLWLTMRSRFIDELGKTDTEILNLWSNFENEQMSIIEREVPNVI